MFVLQRKTIVFLPNILGGHSFPVQTYQWKDVAVSDNKKCLEDFIYGVSRREKENLRIDDRNWVDATDIRL